MATRQAEPGKMSEITVCSICFEKFKAPRFLPCKHSFCHDCLCSYIISQCKSTEPRLGFHCPLCRQYIPSKGEVDKPEEWAGHFPLNDVLQRIVSQPGEKHCEPCLRDNEETTASNYCWSCKEYFCATCTKYHMKFLGFNDHKISQIIEMESNHAIPLLEAVYRCRKHQTEQVQLFCAHHEQPCCGLCGAMEHKKCENVPLIEIAGKELKENGNIDSCLIDTNRFKEELLRVKEKEENNISELEKSVDEKRSQFEEDYKLIVQNLEDLRVKFLDELSTTLKSGREEFSKQIKNLEDGISCVDYCSHGIQMAKDADTETERVIKFCTSKETFKKLKKCLLKETNVQIEIVKTPLASLGNIALVYLVQNSRFIDFDIKCIKLSEFQQFTLDSGKITSGLFLSDGKFLVVNQKEGKCLIYDKEWNCCHVIKDICNPFGVSEQYNNHNEAKTRQLSFKGLPRNSLNNINNLKGFFLFLQ